MELKLKKLQISKQTDGKTLLVPKGAIVTQKIKRCLFCGEKLIKHQSSNRLPSFKTQNKIELLQSQALAERELLGNSVVRTLDIRDFGHWILELRHWKLEFDHWILKGVPVNMSSFVFAFCVFHTCCNACYTGSLSDILPVMFETAN